MREANGKERRIKQVDFPRDKNLNEFDQKGADYKQDYDKIFEIFNRAHYRGFISVEYEGKEDELLAVPRGVKFLKKYI